MIFQTIHNNTIQSVLQTTFWNLKKNLSRTLWDYFLKGREKRKEKTDEALLHIKPWSSQNRVVVVFNQPYSNTLYCVCVHFVSLLFSVIKLLLLFLPLRTILFIRQRLPKVFCWFTFLDLFLLQHLKLTFMCLLISLNVLFFSLLWLSKQSLLQCSQSNVCFIQDMNIGNSGSHQPRGTLVRK